MKRLLLPLFLFAFLFTAAQNRVVLLEEFTGAHCGNCPLGGYYADSLSAVYPNNLITIGLHAYQNYDAMNFPAIDTLYDTYASGAPLAAIDRICSSAPSTNTAVYLTQWDNSIQQRLSVASPASVVVTPSWNSSTRNIAAQVDVTFLTGVQAGDYRVGLYIVEDSVTGIGNGYDQSNIYDQMQGNPFYGAGDPIVGYVHRHVARALLPSAWGLAGLIPTTPVTGNVYTGVFNYTLPASYDENQVSLVAFVYRYSSQHTQDEIINAGKASLMGPAGVSQIQSAAFFELAPNPANEFFFVTNTTGNETINVYSAGGMLLRRQNSSKIETADLENGFYVVEIVSRKGIMRKKILVIH
jgi:hypothetical protein